jgi:hypothetical protein
MADTDEKVPLESVLLTVSVTFTGEGQEPLVAQRVLVNGKAATVPLHILLGLGGDEPLRLFNQASHPVVRVAFAQALQHSASELALSVLAEAADAAKPPQVDGRVD